MGSDSEKPKAASEPRALAASVLPCVLTLTAIIYGSWAVIGKAALSQAGVCPFILVFYRALGGSTLMFMMHVLLERSSKECTCLAMAEQISAWQMPRADRLRFLVLGLFVSMNAGGNILALQALSPITVAIFQPMIPVLAGITAALLGIEELRPLKAFGILCAAAGAVVVVVTNPAAHRHTAVPGGGASLARGLPCLIVNVLGGAWYIVFQKGVLNRYPPIATAAASFGVAACIIFIAALVTVGFDSHAWRLGESWKATFALIYAILLVTSLNYSLLSWANKRSTPSTVTSFMTLQPICAAILSCIFLHDVLTWGQIGGGIAIVAGLLAFLLSKPSESSESEAQPLMVPPEVGGKLPAGKP